jgi:hypothetical protein
MTLVDITFEPPQWLSTIRNAFSFVRHQRDANAAVAHLDDRLRADVGLPPIGGLLLMRDEAAARIAMLALR